MEIYFLKKSQERLSQVKNNREYDALQEEIDVHREKISESETEILRIMDSLDQLKKELEAKKADFKELKQKNEEEIERLDQVLKSIEEKRLLQEEERKKIVVRIDKNLFNTYERIRKGYKNGVAVAKVKRDACGGCFQKIPPQQISEIKKNERIIRCETCGRILIWVEEENNK